MGKAPKTKEKVVETSVFETVSEFVSKDNSLKAVVRRNKSDSLYEVVFYKNKKIVATESYAFHTLRYHEDAAENYVNGIKKLES